MALRLARALWGVTLLVAPRPVLAALGDRSATVERLTRVLGARHLAEASLLLARRGSRPPPRWPMAIDAAHALSMLGLAALAPRHRRAARASAGLACGLVLWAELEREGQPEREL